MIRPLLSAVLATAMLLGAATPPAAEEVARRRAPDPGADLRASLVAGPVRNVILLVGDGLGDSELTMARDYLVGADGRLPGLDALPIVGDVTTFSLHRSGELAGLPDYTPDSAATATAWATGVKSYDGAVGVDVRGTPRPSLIELARTGGLRTGNVTTGAVVEATPGAQVAHVADRGCEGPDSDDCGADALERGGAGSIAEQLLDARADVTLGGGREVFSEAARAGAWSGLPLTEQARLRGYRVATTADQLAALAVGPASGPVLGLLADDDLPRRFADSRATRGGSGADDGVRCRPGPERTDPRLSLAALTTTALGMLDDPSAETGFLLQVESAGIDKSAHRANACGQVGEVLELDEAVQAALAFAREDGRTLVLVTADHGHATQIVEGATPGVGTVLLTADGAPLRVSYATGPSAASQRHTGTQVRIAAYGPGALRFAGLSDQTDLFDRIVGALGLPRDPGVRDPGGRTPAG